MSGMLWQGPLNIQAVNSSSARAPLSGLNLLGSPNTAMTVEFTAAGGANIFETVNLSGYLVV